MAEIAYISLLLCSVLIAIGYFINKKLEEWTYWYIALASFILFSFGALYSTETELNYQIFEAFSILSAIMLLFFTYLRMLNLIQIGIKHMRESTRKRA